MENSVDLGAAFVSRLDGQIYRVTLRKGYDVGVDDGFKILRWCVNDNGGKPIKSLIVIERGCTVDPDVKLYLTSSERVNGIIADALVVKNFAHSLIVNFYLKYHKNPFPTKSFKQEEEAYDWLNALEI